MCGLGSDQGGHEAHRNAEMEHAAAHSFAVESRASGAPPWSHHGGLQGQRLRPEAEELRRLLCFLAGSSARRPSSG